MADINCEPSCSCEGGYGGDDCSLDEAAAADRDTTRGALCEYILLLVSVMS
jgi:hypothetical protein